LSHSVTSAAIAKEKSHRRMRLSMPAFLLWPSLIYYVIFLILPALMFCVVSFYERSDSDFFNPIFTLNNYLKIFTDRFYLNSLWLTFITSAETTLACLSIGYPAAYFLSKCSQVVRKRLVILLLFPLLLSTVIRVYGWIALLGRRGLVNQLLLDGGWIDYPVAFLYTEATVLLGLTSILLPYMIINITNTLITIDPSLREAAAIHGASPLKTFLKVTLPLSRAGMISGSVIVFTIAMSTYIISFLLGGPRIKLIGNLIFDSTNSFNWPMGAALSVVLVLTTTVSCYALMALLGKDTVGSRR